ncbi:MAG: HupE/UreJ family protein [Motiliproteus sp.]
MMPRRFLAGLLLLISYFGSIGLAIGHELQPSTLEIKQLTTDRFEIAWRAPIYYGKPHPARLQLPERWKTLSGPTTRQLPDSALHQRLVLIPGGIRDGETIIFDGLQTTITDVFVRTFWLDGSQSNTLARPSQPWVNITSQPSMWQVLQDYTLLGGEHILSGFDHLTFVLALLLIVSGTRRLLITVTAFTLAHSITLAAATLGLVWMPGPPVEATIALSILFLAAEMIKVERGQASLTAQYPWVVAFVFGLLHGLGFAGALSDVGLPQNEVLLALLMFNVGVELGQLLFVAAMLIILVLLAKIRRQWPLWLRRLPAYGIGSIASFWLIERIAGF